MADLLRNKRSIPYARAWRSDLNMLSITQLMVRLWVAEESRLGVSRPNGVLQNLWQPLQSHERGRGLRSLKKTPARRARSTPTGREAAVDPSLKSSGGDCVTVDARSSATINNSRDSALAVSMGSTAPSTPPADMVHGTALSTTSTSEGGQELGGAADAAGHGGKEGCSLAVALALEACKRAVAIGQGGGGGGQNKKASQMGAEASVAKAMMNLDLRGKIAAVLSMVGFDGSTTDGLGPTDLKASYMATSYMDFRAGAAWQAVRETVDSVSRRHCSGLRMFGIHIPLMWTPLDMHDAGFHHTKYVCTLGSTYVSCARRSENGHSLSAPQLSFIRRFRVTS